MNCRFELCFLIVSSVSSVATNGTRSARTTYADRRRIPQVSGGRMSEKLSTPCNHQVLRTWLEQCSEFVFDDRKQLMTLADKPFLYANTLNKCKLGDIKMENIMVSVAGLKLALNPFQAPDSSTIHAHLFDADDKVQIFS